MSVARGLQSAHTLRDGALSAAVYLYYKNRRKGSVWYRVNLLSPCQKYL